MIIGLSGYAQSGKDTVAKVLVEKYGYRRVAFADPIRDLLYGMDPLVPKGYGESVINYRLQDLVDSYGWEKIKVDYPEVRRLLQDVGVEARRLFGDTFWIYQALSDVAPQDKVVVSDVRFENEAQWIQEFGGQIWRIKRIGTAAVNDHVSESEMDGYKVDQIFVNNGTVSDLEMLIRTRMQSYQ
jgi:hypothetical protein